MSTQSEFDVILKEKSEIFHELYIDQSKRQTAKLDDFQRICTIGQGGFGRVLLVRQIESDKYFALKILSKLQVIKTHQINNAINEKRILSAYLVVNLIQVDLSRRYGNLKNGIHDIKYHDYFQNLNWLQLYHLKLKPPYKPLCHSLDDTRHFDACNEEHLELDDKERFKSVFEDF
ncbi:unnamed protein product [Schistosoma turkestanicum]|nr:unnamed protein product [Schistosoma turkestanicum]